VAQRRARVSEVLALVGLTGFERRDITRLSGGERQRVALARSLAPNPRLLMLDEPLGSLDAVLRERLMVELRDIIKAVGLTAIYVTHDRREAFASADRLAIMDAGIITQIDTPAEVYRRPLTVFAARLLGLGNIVPVSEWQSGMAITPLGKFPLETRAESLLLHPDGLHIAGDSTGITAAITETVFQGDAVQISANANGITLTFKLDPRAALPRSGDRIHLAVAPQAILPLAR
ncbi:MAG: ABC transporter ATP-binding protein, partial [Anaerolinea sp.]|nr:ABC transporter ATP-binding protein [Anaerolinea sp.]